ncbi:hypothetical protein [Deinococcus alpinitundrae]|uniref:hypothetical protein n=1 Tax=Deinococcus alpinitundrae TaxID=468913 RepID=UPI001379BE8D|nr:hypothetical protein [Deinococcus alpinitundrae]
MKNYFLAAIVLALLLSSCAPQQTHTHLPVPTPAPAPAAPAITDSALVTVALDGTSALITLRSGVPLAVVRLRLANGSYSPALAGSAGVVISADLATVRAPLPPDGVVEVAASVGGEFVPLIRVAPPVTFGGWVR